MIAIFAILFFRYTLRIPGDAQYASGPVMKN